VNPALSNPESFGIVPENKMTSTTKRGLILITKVLQNASNGVEFSQKESYMQCMNDYIRANTWRMENYFQEVVRMATNPNLSVVRTKGIYNITLGL
jgi:hypothetical protein